MTRIIVNLIYILTFICISCFAQSISSGRSGTVTYNITNNHDNKTILSVGGKLVVNGDTTDARALAQIKAQIDLIIDSLAANISTLIDTMNQKALLDSNAMGAGKLSGNNIADNTIDFTKFKEYPSNLNYVYVVSGLGGIPALSKITTDNIHDASSAYTLLGFDGSKASTETKADSNYIKDGGIIGDDLKDSTITGDKIGTSEINPSNVDVSQDFDWSALQTFVDVSVSNAITSADTLYLSNSSIAVIDATVSNLLISSSGGGYIILGDNTYIGTGEAGIDYKLLFNGESNNGTITWKEDENYFNFDRPIQLSNGAPLVKIDLYPTTADSMRYIITNATAATKDTSDWIGLH